MFTIEDIKEQKKWKFSEMEINDVVSYSYATDPDLALSSQNYAHVYGRQAGKKFKTRKMKKDGVDYMVIARIS